MSLCVFHSSIRQASIGFIHFSSHLPLSLINATLNPLAIPDLFGTLTLSGRCQHPGVSASLISPLATQRRNLFTLGPIWDMPPTQGRLTRRRHFITAHRPSCSPLHFSMLFVTNAQSTEIVSGRQYNKNEDCNNFMCVCVLCVCVREGVCVRVCVFVCL